MRPYQLSAVDQPVRRQTSQPLTAIIAYRTVQTGPNSHDGGAQDGWTRLLYSFAVPATPSPPISAATVTATKKPAKASHGETRLSERTT